MIYLNNHKRVNPSMKLFSKNISWFPFLRLWKCLISFDEFYEAKNDSKYLAKFSISDETDASRDFIAEKESLINAVFWYQRIFYQPSPTIDFNARFPRKKTNHLTLVTVPDGRFSGGANLQAWYLRDEKPSNFRKWTMFYTVFTIFSLRY